MYMYPFKPRSMSLLSSNALEIIKQKIAISGLFSSEIDKISFDIHNY